MNLHIKVFQKADGSGEIHLFRRKSPLCFEEIGKIAFENEEERDFLLRLLTEGRATFPVEYVDAEE